MNTTTEPLPKPSENSPAGEGLVSSDLFAIDVLTPEFLYKALRPDHSWEINADKAHWEYEAWKLKSSLMRLLPQACRYHKGVNEGRPADGCSDCKANAEVIGSRSDP